MNWQGIIATPFGYIMEGLYTLTSNYGIALILFAALVQAVIVPINRKNQRDREKKQLLQPQIAQIRKEYENDIDKQTDLIAALYDQETISLAGGFILRILPIIILIGIFQVVAQPITYIFHETPETAAVIVNAIRKEAPELFDSGYNQVTALAHIQDYTHIVKEIVPEVSTKTLQGLNNSFLGLDLSTVPGVHLLGKGEWIWDWAHIGAIMLPIVYMARRFYMVFGGMIRSLIYYSKKKKEAIANNQQIPALPKPPLMDLIFLFLSLTAMFAVPIAMDLYWLTSGVAASSYRKLNNKFSPKKAETIKV